ncbi:MAG: TIGR03936 family radical SAM-associated protein [Clostridiales Family XIII bacterium]|jgi:radical SAM-linked protein|nr:TIGR03936 family radical SAM-associated protein [Clostridiales Family XIII bacterium]
MRYLAKFEKKDNMIYISHLDTQRLFHRAIKMLRVDLKYSKGFNPHPKLSFAQPLSLGHASVSEYLEFETGEEAARQQPAALKERFNALLPQGIRILELRCIPHPGKSASSLVAAAKYRIEIPFFHAYREAVAEFFGRECIMAETPRKREAAVDIRPMILALKPLMVDENKITLTSTLHCGSAANLNPERMLQCFYACSGRAYDRAAVSFERTAMLGWKGEVLMPLEYLCDV